MRRLHLLLTALLAGSLLLFTSLHLLAQEGPAGGLQAATADVSPEGEDSVQDAAIGIEIVPPQQMVNSGATAAFSVTVTNEGTEELEDVTVISPQAADCAAGLGTMAPGATSSYQCSRDGVLSAFTNQVTVMATAAGNVELSTFDEALVEVDHLSLVVNPSQKSVVRGEDAIFTVLAINSSTSVDLESVAVTAPEFPTCNRDIGILSSGSSKGFNCIVTAVQAPRSGEFTATALNPGRLNGINASMFVGLEVLELMSELDAEPQELMEPGGPVTFTVGINNAGSISVTLQALNSLPFGDVTNSANASLLDTTCSEGAVLGPGISYDCAFRANVVGPPDVTVQLEATARDDLDTEVVGVAQATVNIAQGPPDITLLPVVLNSFQFIPDEPNDAPCQAHPLALERQFAFLPDDTFDWYRFDLLSTADLQVQLSDFAPQSGQMLVYRSLDGSCDNEKLNLIGHDGDVGHNSTIAVESAGPGRYYVWIINDGATSLSEYYGLRIAVSS